MAIRIDLLPGYVGLRRWFKRILAACLILVGAFAGILFLLYYRDQLALQTLKTNLANIEPIAKQTEDSQAAKAAADAEASPLLASVNFFVDAGRTGPERASILYMIHKYVYAGAVVGSIDLSDGQNAKMTANVSTPDAYATFLMNLRRGTVPTGVLFKNLPSGAGIKGWPDRSGGTATQGAQPGAPGVVPTAGGEPGAEGTATGGIRYRILPNSISVNAALNEPIVVPVPAGAAAPAAAGAPGDPGMPPDPGAPPA
jgi:hypothetical protein